MRTFFPLLMVFIFSITEKGAHDNRTYWPINQISEVLDKAPEFYVLEWKKGSRLALQKIDFFVKIDSLTKQAVFALFNEKKEPVLYTADISTPVCADGECKLMNIKLYWTLLGEYAGFDRYPELPLTKYDHDEFQDIDYQKLHELLIDDKSILGRRSINQLVEKPKMRTVNGVDAISGATIARVKESVVSGALYSCYSAWHIVHSNIREELKAQSLSVLNDNMMVEMLYSNNDDYQLFVLDKIDKKLFAKHYLQIANIFKTSTPLVRSIIAKSLTGKLRNTPELQKPFWEAFHSIDSGTRSLLLRNLEEAPSLATVTLSTKLSTMSKNQLKVYLNHLSELEDVNAQIQDNIMVFANSDSETYSYLVNEFLEENQ